MKGNSISLFSEHLFWDVDKDKLDLNLNTAFMIQRVIEYGLWQDWKNLVDFYGLDRIRREALLIRSLDDVSLSFLSTLFNLDKRKFRCYTTRLSTTDF